MQKKNDKYVKSQALNVKVILNTVMQTSGRVPAVDIM